MQGIIPFMKKKEKLMNNGYKRNIKNKSITLKKPKNLSKKNIAGQKTKQAQSRRKQLEKLEVIEPVQNEHTTDFSSR